MSLREPDGPGALPQLAVAAPPGPAWGPRPPPAAVAPRPAPRLRDAGEAEGRGRPGPPVPGAAPGVGEPRDEAIGGEGLGEGLGLADAGLSGRGWTGRASAGRAGGVARGAPLGASELGGLKWRGFESRVSISPPAAGPFRWMPRCSGGTKTGCPRGGRGPMRVGRGEGDQVWRAVHGRTGPRGEFDPDCPGTGPPGVPGTPVTPCRRNPSGRTRTGSSSRAPLGRSFPWRSTVDDRGASTAPPPPARDLGTREGPIGAEGRPTTHARRPPLPRQGPLGRPPLAPSAPGREALDAVEAPVALGGRPPPLPLRQDAGLSGLGPQGRATSLGPRVAAPHGVLPLTGRAPADLSPTPLVLRLRPAGLEEEVGPYDTLAVGVVPGPPGPWETPHMARRPRPDVEKIHARTRGRGGQEGGPRGPVAPTDSRRERTHTLPVLW